LLLDDFCTNLNNLENNHLIEIVFTLSPPILRSDNKKKKKKKIVIAILHGLNSSFLFFFFFFPIISNHLRYIT
jgi:hypothetical protein